MGRRYPDGSHSRQAEFEALRKRVEQELTTPDERQGAEVITLSAARIVESLTLKITEEE